MPSSADQNIETVWARYRHNLRAFLYARLGRSGTNGVNDADIDDLLQEIMFRSWQQLDSLRDASSLQSWLFSIATNVITDHFRNHARRRNLLPGNELTADDRWYADSIEQADVAQKPLLKELTRCLAPMIQALPPEQSQLLMAVELEGQPQKTLAHSQGLSYSTLKSRVQKARRNLRLLFEDCCDFNLDARGNLADCIPTAEKAMGRQGPDCCS